MAGLRSYEAKMCLSLGDVGLQQEHPSLKFNHSEKYSYFLTMAYQRGYERVMQALGYT